LQPIRRRQYFLDPVVALIDSGTAGAAEVVASALLERNRGQVVGEKSFGAGAEQQLSRCVAAMVCYLRL